MDGIIVAFESDETRHRISDMLESGGMPPSFSCSSGAEAIRAAAQTPGVIVVCGFKLIDMTADELAHTLGGEGIILVMARPTQLELCEQEGIFKLAFPITRSDLLASLRMLRQISEKLTVSTRQRRSSQNAALVSKAKQVLMSNNHMTEEQAHRFIQKKSMDTGSRLEDTAQLIINTYL